MAKDDVFDTFDTAIRARDAESNPWQNLSARPHYTPDYELLETVLAIPLASGSGSESGRFANAIDAWVAHELRRAGFPPDEVWPRLSRPRVLPREVGLFIEGLPKNLKEQMTAQLLKNSKVAPRDANILGRAYSKQVDVVIAQWARGPELMISTKSMVSSFGNNLKNRFEESYGDAKNLRARFPLAAIGFLFVFRSTILDVPARFEKAVDMMRKLRAELDVYDTTCMVLAEWNDNPEPTHWGGRLVNEVKILHDQTPEDLRADRFLAEMITAVLERTPVETHVKVRERYNHRKLAVKDGVDPSDEDVE